MVNSNQGMKIYKGISQQQKCGGHSFFFQLRSKAENPINITILQPIFGNFKIIKSTCINKILRNNTCTKILFQTDPSY